MKQVLLGRRVGIGTAINLVLAITLISAIFFAWTYKEKRLPLPLRAAVATIAEATNQSPKWRMDIVGPSSSLLNSPMGVAVAPDGRVYVADAGNARVQVFSPDGKWIRRFGEPGEAEGKMYYPIDVVIRGERVYVADMQNSRISIYSLEGEYQGALSGKDKAIPPFAPLSLAIDDQNRMYVTTLGHEVFVFDPQDRLVTRYGTPGLEAGQFQYPNGIAVNPAGDVLWVADSGNQRLQRFNLEDNGKTFRFQQQVGGFGLPRGVAIYKDKLFAVDVFAHQVHGLSLNGGERLYTFGGRGIEAGEFNFPNGIAIDQKSGRIYVTDRENNRVSVWSY